jgi:hypothetical protein
LTRPDWKCSDGIKSIVGFSEDHTDEAACVVGTFADESVWNLTWDRSPILSVKDRFDILWLEAMLSNLF